MANSNSFHFFSHCHHRHRAIPWQSLHVQRHNGQGKPDILGDKIPFQDLQSPEDLPRQYSLEICNIGADIVGCLISTILKSLSDPTERWTKSSIDSISPAQILFSASAGRISQIFKGDFGLWGMFETTLHTFLFMMRRQSPEPLPLFKGPITRARVRELQNLVSRLWRRQEDQIGLGLGPLEDKWFSFTQ
ncbi:hypothetical protein GH714_031049 [Hevea brasiliensis]|uniref:Uncharacterized protein n=1 Tax=Hevea brasiliensis TaxID=3981 RepID=A0A6A6N3W7_HEVBR|nr:hypothetical protein GH714_031049 [Hevea brasiliensis]